MIWEKWMQDKWTESIPDPLDLSDSEMLDWMEETGAWAIFSHGRWHVTVDGCKGVAKESLRDAARLAAAYERGL